MSQSVSQSANKSVSHSLTQSISQRAREGGSLFKHVLELLVSIMFDPISGSGGSVGKNDLTQPRAKPVSNNADKPVLYAEKTNMATS